MSTRIQVWLILGCAWVGALEVAPSLRLLRESFRGPYANGSDALALEAEQGSTSVRIQDPALAATPAAKVRERVVRESDVAPGVRRREPSPVRDVLALAGSEERSSDSNLDSLHRHAEGPAPLDPIAHDSSSRGNPVVAIEASVDVATR